MNRIDQLLLVIEAFCAKAEIAEATLSFRLFSDGKRITGLRRGSDIGVRRMERAVGWLSEHWPEGAIWPEDVPRPAPAIATEAAE